MLPEIEWGFFFLQMWNIGVQEEEALGEWDEVGLKKQMEGDLKKELWKEKQETLAVH